MKSMYKLVVVFLAALSLTSCLDGVNEASPWIYVPGNKAYRTSATGEKDSITFAQEMQIHVGDTLLVPMVLLGEYDFITSFTATADTAAFDYNFVCDSSVLAILLPDSRINEGYLHFEAEYGLIPVCFRYVSKKLGGYDISFTLASTASEQFSPAQTTTRQNVVSAD